MKDGDGSLIKGLLHSILNTVEVNGIAFTVATALNKKRHFDSAALCLSSVLLWITNRMLALRSAPLSMVLILWM